MKPIHSINAMQISISPDLEQFISRQVESGKYSSASELISAAVRLLESQQLYQGRFAELQQQIQTGLESLERGERLDGRIAVDQLRQGNAARRPSV